MARGKWLCALAAGFLTYFAGSCGNRVDELAPPKQVTCQNVLPKYGLDTFASDRSIDDLIDVLENVPDNIQAKVNDLGGIMVIFQGDIRDTNAVKHLESMNVEIKCDACNIDQARGVYWSKIKKAMIKEGCEDFGKVALHEYGHMVDYLFGEVSRSDEFVDIFSISLTMHKDAFAETKDRVYASSNEKEFFAECFSEYYFSSDTREKLKTDFPGVYGFIESIERDTVRVKTGIPAR